MASSPKPIGTLVVVVLKAQHLPNKRHIGKQDPYCRLILNGEKKRTRAIKKGGQHPEWDEELRFTLYEDTEDDTPRPTNGSGTPPPPPPKDSKRKKKVKGGNKMLIACFADEPKEPELIGETDVDLTEVLTKGETDEWFQLSNKDKFAGEVYLEMTFWSNEKPPEKKKKHKVSTPIKDYGGPGSFVPSGDLTNGSPAHRDGIPASLRASSSIAHLDLYIPPYERDGIAAQQSQGSAADQIADELNGMRLGPERRRESFPPLRGHTPRPISETGYAIHSYHSIGNISEHSDPGTAYSYEAPTTPVGGNRHPSYHRNSFGEAPSPYTTYQAAPPVQQGGYSPSHSQPEYISSLYTVPSTSSGFVPVSNPTPSGFSHVTMASSGFVPPQSYTPGPAIYAPALSQSPGNSIYGQPPPSTSTPSGFVSPIPPSSSMGFHPQQQMQTYQYNNYPQQQSQGSQMSYSPQGSASLSAPPSQIYQGMTPPPQFGQQHATLTPSPPHPGNSPVQFYNQSPPVQGSRPLPTPGLQQQQQVYQSVTPPHTLSPATSHNSLSPSNQIIFNGSPTNQLPIPPGPPSFLPAVSQSPINGFVPPPPPPPLNRAPLPQPPPPPPPLLQQSHSDGQMQRPLPQPSSLPPPPPVQSSFQGIPPPPPLQNPSHPLPMPPVSNGQGQYTLQPPPRHPSQTMIENNSYRTM